MLRYVTMEPVSQFERGITPRFNAHTLNIDTKVEYKLEFKLVFSWVNYTCYAFHINCIFNIRNCHEDDFQTENYFLIQLTCYVTTESSWEYLGLLHTNGFSDNEYDISD